MRSNYNIALVGNPNVGKSTIYNAITGMKQHTGNWAGKTVDNSSAPFTYKNNSYKLIDLPGTYSLISNSPEEEITKDYILNNNPDCIVIVADATCLERNLNLALQVLSVSSNVILCINLIDEATKNGITIDLTELSNILKIPVVGTNAKKKKSLLGLINNIYEVCSTNKNLITQLKEDINDEEEITKIMERAQNICNKVITFNKEDRYAGNRRIDKILTSKIFGIPIMLRVFSTNFLDYNCISKLSITIII